MLSWPLRSWTWDLRALAPVLRVLFLLLDRFIDLELELFERGIAGIHVQRHRELDLRLLGIALLEELLRAQHKRTRAGRFHLVDQALGALRLLRCLDDDLLGAHHAGAERVVVS